MENKPLPVGTILRGKYRVARLVAGGGMAWVYEVEEVRSDGVRQVWAMKELRADADDTHTLEEGRRLFEQEANILVHLSHPNLPRVAAFFEEQGRSYLVMEYIFGESLEKRLEQTNAPLLEGQVVDWALQVCEVLTYLHTRPTPIIFRDMKPSNVMVTLDGTVKLIDFGIARTYKAGQRKDTITMGSENYAAPEQWGKAQTDARADIYGLGATMYHLLTNVPPLPAFVPTPRVPVQQYNPAVTACSVAVIDRALAKEREQRFPSAEAMRDALLQCLPRRERQRLEARLLQRRQPAAVAAPAAPAAPPAERMTAAPVYAPEPRRAALPQPVPAAPAREPVAAPRIKFCPRCGAENGGDARFCRSCAHVFVAPLPPVLVMTRPTSAHWEYPLRSESILLGRQGGQKPVDLNLEYYDDDGFVSRNHAMIAVQQRRYYLTDLGSANGTFVNGQQLTPHTRRLLRNGDRIRLGRVVLQFRIR